MIFNVLTVPVTADRYAHTQLFAAMEAPLNTVTVDPLVRSVVVVPAVSTLVPPPDLSVPCLITHVALGDVPVTTARMSVIVAALATLNSVIASVATALSIVTDFVIVG